MSTTGGAGFSAGATDLAASTLDLISVLGQAHFSRKIGGINDRMTREQIRIASSADAAARVRGTANLISAQRGGMGAAGVGGGRTARLLEARARINAGREQRQADQSRVFGELSSRLERIQNRTQARSGVFKASGQVAADLFSLMGGGK